MTSKQIFILAVAIVLLIIGVASIRSLVEVVDSNEIVIIQAINGNLTFATSAGPWGQWFGTTERFKKREQLWFTTMSDKSDRSMKIRFNDNGHGNIYGSIAWTMPTDPKCLTKIFQQYRTQEAIENQLIKTVTEKAVYMSGPMMSSTESAAERRNELLQLIEDQVKNGVYLTHTVQTEQEDPITKEKRHINVAEIVKDKDGKPIRAAGSPLTEFCIGTSNLTINEVRYDKEVEGQIRQQQQAIMAVRIAMANAAKSEQDVRTVAAKGAADAASAKWEQEKINATLIAEAEGKRKAEEQNAKAAEYYKTALLLKADGDAGYRSKIMQADNALEKRLEVYERVSAKWADAVKGYQGAWVPAVSSGNGGSAGSGASQLIDLLSAKTAQELGVDLGLRKK